MLSVRDITIDAEFEGLIPALSDDERLRLMTAIGRDGFRDPLVVWLNHGILLDGHNRYRIWEASFQDDENREPSIVEMKFATREDAIAWVIKNQLGRRNLTDAQRVQLALRLKPEFEAKANANKKASGGAVRKNASEPVRTMADVAKVAGVSEPTARNVERALAGGVDEVKADLLQGKVSASKAARVACLAPSEQKAVRARGYKDEPVEPTSTAMKYAEQAVTILKRIRDDDAERLPALEYISDFVASLYETRGAA